MKKLVIFGLSLSTFVFGVCPKFEGSFSCQSGRVLSKFSVTKTSESPEEFKVTWTRYDGSTYVETFLMDGKWNTHKYGRKATYCFDNFPGIVRIHEDFATKGRLIEEFLFTEKGSPNSNGDVLTIKSTSHEETPDGPRIYGTEMTCLRN